MKTRLKYDDHERTFIKLWIRLDELANGEKAELELEEARARDGDIQESIHSRFEPEKDLDEAYWLHLETEEATQEEP